MPHSPCWCLKSALSLVLLLVSGTVAGAFSESALNQSIVTIQVYKGKEPVKPGSGFVVQADRFNGYVVTNFALVNGGDTFTVKDPGNGAELVAQVLRSDELSDYALLKVNGLNLPALPFATAEPGSGEVVWSAGKRIGSSVIVSKGILRTGFKLTREATGWYQHTALFSQTPGSVLLNECGQVLGLNFSTPAADGSMRALDLSSLRSLLLKQNVNVSLAEETCVSEVMLAQQKAEMASREARRAQGEAEKAQAIAKKLEVQLQESKRSNADLIRTTRQAKERAEVALKVAEAAEVKAEETRLELEEKTRELREETQALVRTFEEESIAAAERFQDLLASQQESADTRERILAAFAGALIVIIMIVVFLARYRAAGSPAVEKEVVPPASKGHTRVNHDDLDEYVLDGRDDDGIRYLLRISGDQLVDQDGVIIGRNPKDSPYIINHADVSRKHARIKVMKNRVFIEDLGSTNGTSVNGQSIDDKGLVSVSSGDQIIIGSVVMKLRVMEA